MGTPEEPINDSKGCGGVMRAAPAGLLRLPPERAFALGCEIAATTHGHPSGFLAAGCLASIVGALVDGASVGGAVAAARGLLVTHPGAGEVDAALAAATSLAAKGTPRAEEIESLGEGWVAEEALAIAVCCALVGERLGEVEPALRLAVNHSGDSDSTGAVTGNLLGARHGRQSLLDDLLLELELRDVVETLAEDLVKEVCGVAPATTQWWERYPGD
jgi:ADP-ribosylglycohydrolase